MAFNKIQKKLKKSRVVLCRHGATDLNHDDTSIDRIRGWVDVPLNNDGREEAEHDARKLKNVAIDAMFASDLVRARETADIINQYHNVPIISSKALRPWNLGDFQGKITDNVLHLIEHYIENPDEKVPGGEPFNEFAKRYLSHLKNIVDQSIKDHQILVVATHLRNLKLCDGWVKNGMPDDYSVNPDTVINDNFEPGALYEFPINKYLKRKEKE